MQSIWEHFNSITIYIFTNWKIRLEKPHGRRGEYIGFVKKIGVIQKLFSVCRYCYSATNSVVQIFLETETFIKKIRKSTIK